MEVEPADTEQACPRCQQTDFNYEDLDEGTKLVCRDCGYVLDVEVLVHQRTFDEEGALQAGVRVGAADDGRLAGEQLHLLLSSAVQLWVFGQPCSKGHLAASSHISSDKHIKGCSSRSCLRTLYQRCESRGLNAVRCRNCWWQQLEGQPGLSRQQTPRAVTKQGTARWWPVLPRAASEHCHLSPAAAASRCCSIWPG
jgi:hypothetical protein